MKSISSTSVLLDPLGKPNARRLPLQCVDAIHPKHQLESARRPLLGNTRRCRICSEENKEKKGTIKKSMKNEENESNYEGSSRDNQLFPLRNSRRSRG